MLVASRAMTTTPRERAVLVGVILGGQTRSMIEGHLDELAQLVDTAGGEAVARIIQERSSPDRATFIGKGKVEELAAAVKEFDACMAVFDDDITGSQVRHLEEGLPEEIKVIDRAGIILDIFASRARSREAQTQVELAQMKYMLSRLTRRWTHLSRQAGGIGTRGVGETQLESDRRVIRTRIAALTDALGEIEQERGIQRRRRRAEMLSVALVGYTNAGKSTLFERLTRSSTLIEDRLFATLDSRVRRADLGDEMVITVADTVGFIRKLPHDLVASFRSTLAEAGEADVLLHLVDASHPDWPDQLRVGEEVLASLDLDPRDAIIVLNKIDRVALDEVVAPLDRVSVLVSARDGIGIDGLKTAIRQRILARPDVALLRFSPEGGEALGRAMADETVIARRFGPEGIELVVRRRLSGA